MEKAIDVSTLKISLYSEKSVREYNQILADPEGKMWLSNESALIAANAMALALKAIRKSKCEDEDIKAAASFLEVLRNFFLKVIDQELQSRSAWEEEINKNGRTQARIDGCTFAACSEIDEVLYGLIKAMETLEPVADKILPAAAADAAAAVLLTKTAMDAVKLQRYYYSNAISGDVQALAMRREPEMAIENSTELIDGLYTKFVNMTALSV